MSRRKQNGSMLLAVALLAGCVRGCGCGGETASNDHAQEEEDSVPALPPSGPQGTAGTSASASGGPGRTQNAQQFTPAPDSKLTRQLIAARDTIDRGKLFPKLGAPAEIAAVLGDKLGEFHAEGPVSSTTREGSGTGIALAARNYVAGKRGMRVKIIDTARSPEARRAVSERIAEIGNPAAGNQRGAFVRGYPAVVAGFEADHASRATALIADRYLVQVMVREPVSPDQALQLIGLLDWGKLAPKQGKLPASQ
jgi:hypothetical protein